VYVYLKFYCSHNHRLLLQRNIAEPPPNLKRDMVEYSLQSYGLDSIFIIVIIEVVCLHSMPVSCAYHATFNGNIIIIALTVIRPSPE